MAKDARVLNYRGGTLVRDAFVPSTETPRSGAPPRCTFVGRIPAEREPLVRRADKSGRSV
jgi:hypothetical protein